MSRLFDDAASDKAVFTGTPGVTAAPLTLSMWVYPDSVSAIALMMTLGNNGANGYFGMRHTAAGVINATTEDDSGNVAQSAGGTLVVNKWQHVAAVFASTTSRLDYLNGVPGSINTTSITDPTPDFVAVGCRQRSTASQFFSGRIGMVAVWSVALSAAEIAALASGVSPPWVQGANLVHFYPLLGNDSPEIDLIGAADLTLTGTAKAADPVYTTDWRHGGPLIGPGRVLRN